MDFNRNWTQFALEAEEEMFGMGRIAAAHNALRAEVAQLRLETKLLKVELAAGSEAALDLLDSLQDNDVLSKDSQPYADKLRAWFDDLELEIFDERTTQVKG